MSKIAIARNFSNGTDIMGYFQDTQMENNKAIKMPDKILCKIMLKIDGTEVAIKFDNELKSEVFYKLLEVCF